MAHLRQWLSRPCLDPDTDASLLRRFAADRDETAFAVLVDRHGPMVLGVARRMVGDHHTAEDIFQATFLALARQGERLRRPAALSAWLHNTACNIAVTVLRTQKRRQKAEAGAEHQESRNPLDDLSSRELLTILDEELRQLPETFRLPLVLCCLEGRSQDEAALTLGWTPGSVKGRLERGRQRLRDRLAHRGLTFAVGAGVPLLAIPPSLAGPLRETVLRAACDGGIASPVVLALANGATQTLSRVSWRALLAIVVVGMVGVGIGLTRMSPPGPPAMPPLAAEDKPAADRAGPRDEPLPEGAVARLGSSRLRIGNSAFALTPDGRTIVTVSPEGTVREFDANTGRSLQRRQLADRDDVVPEAQCFAQLSADGKTAAIEERTVGGRRVTVWDVQSGKVLLRSAAAEGRSVGEYALSPDGKQLAVPEGTGEWNETRTLRVYDLETGRGKEVGGLASKVPVHHAIRFTTNGKRVLVSQTQFGWPDPENFACFDVAAGKQLWQLPGSLGSGVWAVSPDGKTLVSRVLTQEVGFHVIEIEPASGRPTKRFKPYQRANVIGQLVIAPDNRTVVGNPAGELAVWDLQTWDEFKSLSPSNFGRGYGPLIGAFSADSRTVVTNQGHLQRWDLASLKPLFDVPPKDEVVGPIQRLAFTADGKELVASSWGFGWARWDVATGKPLSLTQTGSCHQMVTTPAGLRALRFFRQEKQSEVTLTDLSNGKVHSIRWVEPQLVEEYGHWAFTLTANGKDLLVASPDKQQGLATCCVMAFDPASGRRLSQFAVPGSASYRWPPFSPCGRWALLNGKVYYTRTGTELFTPTGEPGERLHPEVVWFSQDGRLMAGLLSPAARQGPASEDTLAVWELASGKRLARIPRGTFVGQVAFAPAGRTLALFDAQGVSLHDLLTGQRVARYPAPDVTAEVGVSGGPQSLVFAPDGRTLATGHRDGSVLKWKVPQPAEEGRNGIKDAERETLWTDLGSESPARAKAAVERLVRHPAVAVALLKDRFRPAQAPTDAALAALLKDLDSEQFAIREQADRKLREYGARAEPDLRRTLAGNPTLELRRRVEAILEAIPLLVMRLPLAGEALRGVRAIEVLERAGSAEARVLLRAWADQIRDLRLAAEARAALERAGRANPTKESVVK
jgi:RNA polymerase sigma factor (sigma-70 family)